MRTISLVTLILAGAVLAASAQNAPDDTPEALRPYIGELTVAAGVLDWRNVDLGALATAFESAGLPKAEAAKFKQEAISVRAAFVKAGGSTIGFVLNLEDTQGGGPLFVVPVAAGGKPLDIADMFTSLGPYKAKIKDGTVLVGLAPTLERALNRQAANSPDLSKAFAAVASSPTRIATTLPPALRKSLEELMPNLPADLGGDSITVVTRGVRWGALGINLAAGKQEIRAVVQGKDDAAAKKLAKLGELLIELAGKMEPAGADAVRGLEPKVKDDQVRLVLGTKQLEQVVLPMVAKIREAGARTQSMNNLKQLALAMLNYYHTYKTLPAQAIYGKQKKALLSWRVELLPYLQQQELYKQFKLDEPWDSPANKPLIAKMPAVFRSPRIVAAEAGKTTYLVPVGAGLLFDGPRKTKINQITDGTANTILIVEANDSRAVWWTQPADYEVNPKMPKAGLFRPDAQTFLVAFADGSVRGITRAISDTWLWAHFTPAAGDIPEGN